MTKQEFIAKIKEQRKECENLYRGASDFRRLSAQFSGMVRAYDAVLKIAEDLDEQKEEPKKTAKKSVRKV